MRCPVDADFVVESFMDFPVAEISRSLKRNEFRLNPRARRRRWTDLNASRSSRPLKKVLAVIPADPGLEPGECRNP
jgi:hypothetical protein